MSDFQRLFDEHWRQIEARLKQFGPSLQINLSTQVRGSLPNRNLAPIALNDLNLMSGVLSQLHGGTGNDLTADGPGILFQASAGSAVSSDLAPFDLIDFSNGGASSTGFLFYNSGTGLADFISLPTITATGGGTGITSYTRGDLLYANSTTTLAKLADVATGNALISGGVGADPSWGKIALTTHVSGQLGPGNGGTGTNNSGNLAWPSGGGTAALLGVVNQAFTDNNSFQKLLRAQVTSGSTGYGIRFWDGSTDFGNFQSLDLGGVSYIFFATNRQFDGSAWQQLNSRAGGDLQITGDALSFNVFPVSSTTAVRVLNIANSGLTTHQLSDAATNTAPDLFLFQHITSGTPAAGFGLTIETDLDDSTTANVIAATDVTTWATATHASRKARRVRNIYDTVARETIREEASGTAAMIGFLGAAAVVRQNITGVHTGTLAQLQTVVANLLTGLANLGLITDSTT